LVLVDDLIGSGQLLKSSPLSKNEVTVVIPVKNEELAINSVVDELFEEGYFNILVVDGYSTDNTRQIVSQKNGITFVTQHGRGKTGAIKTAIELVKTPYLLVLDGDFTYPAKDIQRLLDHSGKYEEVIGVRNRENISFVHRFGNGVITYFFNTMFSSKLSDICSGMYVLKTQAARELDLSSAGFITEVEIAAQMVTQFNVTEVPIEYRSRVGKGKLSTWNGFGILLAVGRLARKYNPVLLFTALGSVTIVPAIGILGWVFYQQTTAGIWHSGWALVGVATLLFALQNVSVASVSAIMKRMEHRITQRLKEKNI
jgi:dolichol-phosphate hexosyltransferase